MTRVSKALALTLACLSPAVSMVTPAWGAPPAVALSAEDQTLVQRAAAYIQSLTTVQGRFAQTSSRGGSSAGTFSMQRPGKARFQYDAPADLLVVSDGANVKVFDRRLRTFDQYPLGQTPLVLLLAREVRLDRGVLVTGVKRTESGFAITARDARRQAEGSITLDFADAPLGLRGWTIVDAQGVETRIRLGALKPVPRLDPKLFELSDPRGRSGTR